MLKWGKMQAQVIQDRIQKLLSEKLSTSGIFLQ